MDKKYWHQRWQSNEIGFNQSKPNQLMQRYFPLLNLEPSNHIFVPLCGKSIDMIWLAGQGYKVTGIELSESACQAFFSDNKIAAKKTQTDNFVVYSNNQITLFSGDFFKLNKSILDKIDAVYDRAAFVALPASLRSLYTEKLSQLLAPETKICLITTLYNQKQMQGPPFSIDESEIDTLFGLNFEIEQLYSKPLMEIPLHLKSKGLLQATEQVHMLTKKY